MKKRDGERNILFCMVYCELNIPFAQRILSYVPGEEEVEIGGSRWRETVEMGANTSQVSDLSTNPSLKTLVGTESISENDPFWNQLISFTFISPTSRYTRPHGMFAELYFVNDPTVLASCLPVKPVNI